MNAYRHIELGICLRLTGTVRPTRSYSVSSLEVGRSLRLSRPIPLPALLVACGGLLAGCASPPRDEALVKRIEDVSRTDVDLPEEAFRGLLDFDTALARAGAASEEVAMLVSEVDIAAKEKLMAGDLRDPELRTGYGESAGDGTEFQSGSEVSPITGLPTAAGTQTGNRTEDADAFTVGLRVFPPNPWARAKAIAAGSAATFASIADLLESQWILNNTVRRLFVQTHFLAERLKVYREMTEVYGKALQIARSRAAQGHSTVEDVMATSRRYLGAMADRDQAARELSEIRQELANCVAVPVDDLHLKLDSSLLAVPKVANVDKVELERQALENRRDLAALYWRTAQARAEYESVRASRLPWFAHVQGTYGVNSSVDRSTVMSSETDALGLPSQFETSQSRMEDDSDEWRIEAAVTLPIFPGGNHEVDVAVAKYRSAQLGEAKAQERIKREIRDALSAVLALKTGRQRYMEETRTLTQDMKTALGGVADEAMLDPLDVARMREQILESRRMEIESELDYQLAIIHLEEVLGLRLSGR